MREFESPRAYLTLKCSYNLSRDSHDVFPEIVEYYEEGLEFSRRSVGFTAEARHGEWPHA